MKARVKKVFQQLMYLHFKLDVITIHMNISAVSLSCCHLGGGWTTALNGCYIKDFGKV